MDGIHDLGGMDGFGSVPHVGDDAVFHETWEGQVHAMLVTLLSQGVFNTDEFRHARERVSPDYYLDASYYDLALTGIETLLLEHGVVALDEFEAATAAFDTDGRAGSSRTDPDLAAAVRRFVREADHPDVTPREPAYESGDRVTVRNDHPPGHTRAPGYARRATGVVERHYGTYRLPDANAHGESAAYPVYRVRFDGDELWGSDRGDATAVSLDLWECYLRRPTE